MSDLRSDDELVELLTRAGERAHTPSPDLTAVVRRLHRRRRTRQAGVAVLGAAAALVVGVSISGSLGSFSSKARPATIGTRPGPSSPVVTATSTQLPGDTFIDTDAASGDIVIRSATTGRITRDLSKAGSYNLYRPQVVTLGPSGRYVYWIQNSATGVHAERVPVGGGAPQAVATLAAPDEQQPTGLVANTDDTAIAYAQARPLAQRSTTSLLTMVTLATGATRELPDSSARPVGWTSATELVVEGSGLTSGAAITATTQSETLTLNTIDVTSGTETHLDDTPSTSGQLACGTPSSAAIVLPGGEIAQAVDGCMGAASGHPAGVRIINAATRRLVSTRTLPSRLGGFFVQSMSRLSDGSLVLVLNHQDCTPSAPEVRLAGTTATGVPGQSGCTP